MSVSNSLIHVSNQEGKLGMYHVTMEIWIEPKLGTCQKGPEIAKGKDFLKIANDQFTRDHQLIIMETTFNRLKDRLKQELENDKRGVTMEDDRDHDLDQARVIHKMSSVLILLGHTFLLRLGRNGTYCPTPKSYRYGSKLDTLSSHLDELSRFDPSG